MYFVKITPIIPDNVYWQGPFGSEESAWAWVDSHNCPYVDYQVIEDTEGIDWEED